MFGRKKSEVEFKGVKASNDKRSAVILFIVEAIVVLLFIAGVLFVLNFVGIISLSGINTTLFGRLPINQSLGEVSVLETESENPEYKLKVINEEAVVDYLIEIGFFDERFTVVAKEDFIPKGIIIALSNEDQKGLPYINSENQEITHSVQFEGLNETDQVRMKIYLSQQTLESTDLDKSESFNAYFLYSLYRFMNPNTNLELSSEYLKKFHGDRWFEIEKL